MSDKNKRRVFCYIHHREQYSVGENRRRLVHSAYHWGIMITPKISEGRDCIALDVSEGMIIDDTNPNLLMALNMESNWHFRCRRIALSDTSRRIKMIMIGKVPNSTTDEEIRSLLASIPLPDRSAIPTQNSVTWTKNAILKLQQHNLAEDFNVDEFFNNALLLADARLANPGTTSPVVNPTRRPD